MNFIAIHGRLVHDPELRQTQSGVSVCGFTVAVDRAYQKDEKQADFFNCTAWRSTADFVSKFFHKGKEIIVTGEMQSRKYQDKEGNNRTAWEIQVSNVEFCGKKGDNENCADSGYAVSINHSISQDGQFPELSDDDGELPF